MRLISVVIPFFNEGENIRLITEELLLFWKQIEEQYKLEVILLDNHSSDSSYRIARSIVDEHPRFRLIRLSRNFGYQNSILTGYLRAQGDAVIQLDSDGEDDPKLISKFISEWEAGAKVVYGVRIARTENFFMQLVRRSFYRLVDYLSSVRIPVDAGDFRLVDRQVIEELRKFEETNIYLRGIFSFIGYQQKGVKYARRSRYDGRSKFSWNEYFNFAVDGLLSFSRVPLVFVSRLGAVISILSILLSLMYLTLYFLTGFKLPGFATLIIVLLFLSGVQICSIGILGAYIARIFDEVKGRPRSIIEHEYRSSLPDENSLLS